MSQFGNIFVYSFIAGLSTIIGVYLVKTFPNWTKKNSLFLISVAVGVILGTTFLELVPEFSTLNSLWYVWFLSGILGFYVVEEFLMIHGCREDHCEVHAFGIVGALGMAFHSFLDGVLIGVGFEINFALGMLAAIAVIFHEVPEGVFSYTILKYAQIKEQKTMIYCWIVTLATPVGAIITYPLLKNVPQYLLAGILAFAAGNLLYVAVADLVPETHKKSSIFNPILVFLGIIFIFLIKKIFGV